MSDEKTRRFAANSLFVSLFLAVFGLALAQAGVAKMSGSLLAHVLFGLPGIALSGLAFYRARLHWPARIALAPGGSGDGRPPSGVRDLACYLLLFGTGIAVASLAEGVILLGIVAWLMYFVPWVKLPVCRKRFVPSSIVTVAGALAWLALYGKPVPPLDYVVAASIVSMPALTMQLLVLVSLPGGYRVRESGP